MNAVYSEEWPQFFTATIREWRFLLHEDQYKKIIIDCFKFLKIQKRVNIYAYVIMSNHIHIIWQSLPGYTIKQVQRSFTNETARQFAKLLSKENKLEEYKSNAPDRNYSFWKRDPLSIELFTPAVFDQKMNYIHCNPVRAGICDAPEQYKYSSAFFYCNGNDPHNVLTHWAG